jgi:ribosomal-protein-alanine N-acetyltransferase
VSTPLPERTVTIETARLILTLPPPDAAASVVRYYEENRAHFAPTDPPRPSSFYTDAYWRERLIGARRAFAEDRALQLFLFERSAPDVPVGAVNFTNFIRGPFQACLLGYGIAWRIEGKGYATEALRAAIPLVFEGLGLHRIMANHLPENERSARLLARLGFAKEGYAKDYLFIGGTWRDHVLNALTNPDPQDPVV